MNIIVFSILLLPILTILIIGFILNPDSIKNIYYWGMLLWLCFLVFLNWSVGTLIVFESKNLKNPLFGIIPLLNFSVFIYSLISGTLLILNWVSQDYYYISKTHLILQIIFFSIIAIIALTLLLTSKFSETGDTQGLISKKLLADRILLLRQQSVDEGIKKKLSDLYDAIKYNSPHLSKIDATQYKKVCDFIIQDQNKVEEELKNETSLDQVLTIAKFL